MQINTINTNLSVITKQNNDVTNINNNMSFKGKFPLDNHCLTFSTIIENGGFKTSFLIVDGLGTVLPRIIEGACRNKDENDGQFNYRFAAKEATREIFSGPSIFLIPFAIDKLSVNQLSKLSNVFGEANNISADIIKEFGEIHAENAVKNGKFLSKEEFYKNTFCAILRNAKGEIKALPATQKEAEIFAKRLYDASQSKEKNALTKEIDNLSKKFISISKKYAKDTVYTDFTAVKLSDGVSSSFKKVASNMINYADDVVEKVSKSSSENAKDYTMDLVNKKIICRTGLNIAKFAAVVGFFQYIPKLYNKIEGDENAGLKGLMQKETFSNNELNQKNDKSNPAFGSSSSIAKKITNKDSFLGKLSSIMEFDGSTMSFYALSGFMGGGILYPRIKNARDEYDREEIIRRDVVTCAVMCVGEKILRKGFSKLNEISSGLVLAVKDVDFKKKNIVSKVLDYLNPVNGVSILSSEQIRAKYTNIDKYNGGIKGFCDFISGQGGNLYKVFSLTDKSKSIIDDLLKKSGIDIKSADNENITKILSDEKNKKEAAKLADLFHSSRTKKITNKSFWDRILRRTEIVQDNPWVKKARTLHARFTTLSVLVIVPGFLGIALPRINEQSTKRKIKAKQSVQKNNNINQNKNKQNFYIKRVENKSIFAEMENFAK